MRTIALRVEDELHEVLTLLARLSGRPLVDELREAIDSHIARRRSEVDLTASAEQALEQIDTDAATRRKAIQSLLAGEAKADKPEPTPRKGKRNA